MDVYNVLEENTGLWFIIYYIYWNRFFQWQFHGAVIRHSKRKREIWEYFVDLQYVYLY